MRAGAWLTTLAPLVILLLSGLLRAEAMDRSSPLEVKGDERYYVRVAHRIASEGEHFFATGKGAPARAWRPPAHPWLLSHVSDPESTVGQAASPKNMQPLLWLQVGLSTTLVAATYLLALALFSRRTALGAAVLVGCHPTLVAFSHYLWAENLCTLLLTAGLAAVATRRPAKAPIAAILTGALFGVTALTREVGLVVAGASACWFWLSAESGERRRAFLNSALMVAVAVAVVAPWTLRNHRELGRFVPVGTVGWFATAEGNSLDSEDWFAGHSPHIKELRQGYFALQDEAERMDFARDFALERIAAEQPAWLLKKTVRNLSLLMEPDSTLLEKLRRNDYGDVSLGLRRAWAAATYAFWALLIVLAAAGILTSGERRGLLAALVLGFVFLLHVYANAHPRFRVPWLPLASVFAAQALLHPRLTLGALDAKRRVALLLWVALAAGLGLARHGDIASANWNGPELASPLEAPGD